MNDATDRLYKEAILAFSLQGGSYKINRCQILQFRKQKAD